MFVPELPPATPPPDEEALFARARAIAGWSLGDLARALGRDTPPDLRRHKGWVGNLVELALGADAASRDEPDFRGLGIELKTLPVDARGKPCETTFVATIPLSEVGEQPWEISRVYRKLARVLWMPYEGDRTIPLADRRLGEPLLWSPSQTEAASLRHDWEELAGLIGRGDVESITAHLGRFLQVRPKAAHGRVRRRAIDAEGTLIETLPRGFYLRTQFTEAILRRHFPL